MGVEIRVLVVDDQPDIRRLFETLLSLTPDLHVVGSAHNGLEAVELVRELHPDVVLLDVGMPVLDGVGALPLIRQASPNTAVVFLTALDPIVVGGLDADHQAEAVLPKAVLPSELYETIRRLVK